MFDDIDHENSFETHERSSFNTEEQLHHYIIQRNVNKQYFGEKQQD